MGGVDAAPGDDDSLRERGEALAASLRERFDEPLSRATALTRRTLAWFGVRVWRHFLRNNGFLLAASISYQSLFSIFAVIYVAFASVGVWVGGSPAAIERMIGLVNRYIPNLISDEGGLIAPEAVTEVAGASGGVLAVTGAVALAVAIWTAIGFVTFTRRAVRDIFGLSFDPRNYFILKTRDLIAAALFGLALIIGGAVGSIAGGLLDWLLGLAGLGHRSIGFQIAVRALSALVAFAVNSVALAALVRFLAGTSLPWRTIWPGALLGGAAIAVLQVGVGLLFSYTPSNPLLATFSVMIGFLVWFRLVGIVILVCTSWIAVAAQDGDIPLRTPSQAERLLAEHEALLTAAHIRLREARAHLTSSPWYRRRRAARAVREAEVELARVEASAPPLPIGARR
ncbi:hypothetical protein GCM10022240_21420 [Microbacterium kribbense]|uniref:YihY/virulence factor BrkB family protein n=2 Tax=Microbacterium kribbense TaxID=433645 RepID=A0ABP7GMV1_9MICO